MIEELIKSMMDITHNLQEAIQSDIEDVKKANHERLLLRNDEKQKQMEDLVRLKQDLNNELVKAMKSGIDVNVYRDRVDELEEELKKLYTLNGRLAAIVLPVQQMYKEIVDELTELNGGSLVEIRA